MKLKKTRLLSLLLVLAMMLALVPSVFAANGLVDGTVAFSNTTALTGSVGGKITITTATCAHDSETEENNSKHTIAYSIEEANPSGCVTIGTGEDAGKLIAVKAGTAKLVATCACGGKTATGITVTIGKKSLDPTITIANFNVKTGTSESEVKQQLEAKYTDAIKDYADKAVLSHSDWTLPEGTSFANTADTALTYTAKVTVAEAYQSDYEMTEKTLNVTVTFKNAPQIKTTTQKVSNAAGTLVEGSTLECGVGATGKQLRVVVTTEPTENVTVSYQWLSGTTYSATAEGYTDRTPSESSTPNTFTLQALDTNTDGRKYFACKITATNADGLKDEKLVQFTVNVNKPYRIVITPYSGNPSSPKVGNTLYYTVKTEKYSGLLPANDGYVATTSADNISLTVNATSAGSVYCSSTTSSYGNYYVQLRGAANSGSTSFTLSATAKQSTTTVADNSTTVGFTYATTDQVTMTPYSSTVAYMDMNALSNAVYSATSGFTPSSIYFSSTYGTFNGTSSSYTTASVSSTSTYFTPSSSYVGFTNSNMSISFNAYDSNGKMLATGTIKFTSTGSISYSTTASTPVYFKASDFSDFFKTAVGGTYASSYYAPSLTSVTFSAPRVSTGSATLGSLNYNGYTYGSSYYNTYFNNIAAANLGYVSYTPSSSTSTYTVSVPFTAVGTYSGSTRTINGTVTIKVNDGHVITMLGTDFKSASVWSDIISKHPNTSYVVFSQPQTTVGKLYYGYSSIASKGTLVSYSDKFNNTSYNYSYASTYKSIDGIYFVPAAGCLDTVTIAYTAYTSNGAQIGTSDTITFTVTKKTASAIFNDVTASNTGNWSADAVDFLARNSIVEGSSYSTFNPNGNMTRGDFVLMLYRLAGKPSVSGISNPFTDVKSTDYYYNAILWAYRNDIVTGTTAKTFEPKKNITREQIAATLYRLAGSPSTSGYITGYYDYAKVHSYATNAMKWAVSNGYVTGSNGYLTPTANATRAQVATMLHRYLTK